MRLFLATGRLSLGALIVGLVFFATTTVHAQETDDATATIEIIANLEIVETTPLDFGTIGKPSDGTTTFMLAADGSTSTDGADSSDGFFVDGTSQEGLFDITGNDGETVNVEAFIDDDFGDAGVTLDALDIAGDGETHQLSLDGNGDAQVGLGGDVIVDDSAEAGTYTADITLTASYE